MHCDKCAQSRSSSFLSISVHLNTRVLYISKLDVTQYIDKSDLKYCFNLDMAIDPFFHNDFRQLPN